MSASFGRYAPARKQYGDWAFRTIHRRPSRQTVAGQLRQIRAECGATEAREYRDYLLWLGTFPTADGAAWRNKYGVCPVCKGAGSYRGHGHDRPSGPVCRFHRAACLS